MNVRRILQVFMILGQLDFSNPVIKETIFDRTPFLDRMNLHLCYPSVWPSDWSRGWPSGPAKVRAHPNNPPPSNNVERGTLCRYALSLWAYLLLLRQHQFHGRIWNSVKLLSELNPTSYWSWDAQASSIYTASAAWRLDFFFANI